MKPGLLGDRGQVGLPHGDVEVGPEGGPRGGGRAGDAVGAPGTVAEQALSASNPTSTPTTKTLTDASPRTSRGADGAEVSDSLELLPAQPAAGEGSDPGLDQDEVHQLAVGQLLQRHRQQGSGFSRSSGTRSARRNSWMARTASQSEGRDRVEGQQAVEQEDVDQRGERGRSTWKIAR